jgi:hypothetical protein
MVSWVAAWGLIERRRYGGRVPVVSVAVCPHPPLIIPEIAAGAAAELDDLRTACDGAIDGLAGSGADTLVVLGAGGHTRWLPAYAHGSFAPFGVSIEVTLAAGAPAAGDLPGLPLSVAVGAWLLARRRDALAGVRVAAATVAADALAADRARLAASLAHRPGRVALLVMGDGSACRGQRSPGYDDPRARPYDDAVARAMDTADLAVLRDLDGDLSAGLLVAGRAPWQVLAEAAAGGAWRGRLSYYAAPYGVAYFVAGWELA